MNLYKKEKEQLIKNGKFNDYKQIKKDFYNSGCIPSDDPKDYNLNEQELDLIKRLEKSTKRKKQDFRRHAQFMNNYYDNIGLLTLSYSEKALNKSKFNQKKEKATEILKQCFSDYIGKFEISPNGRLHLHAIVAWNGETKTIPSYRNNYINNLVINKSDLQILWYGEKDKNGQPTKYGIYDLILIPKNKKDREKATNYSMKSLNSMESYITKDEKIDLNNLVDDELIFQVNTSNILTARNTPYQKFKKEQDLQDKEIKKICRTFDTSFYDKNKFNSKVFFREWATENKTTNISLKKGTKIELLGKNFKLIDIKDF